MTLTQLIDKLRDRQAKYGDVEVRLGQASGPNLPAHAIVVDAVENDGGAIVQRVIIYPPADD